MTTNTDPVQIEHDGPQPKTFFSPEEKAVLRSLARQVAELAARPIEAEKRALWTRHNALQSTRPLIFCDPENGWHEIIRREDLQCAGALARQWEFRLRQEIFWGAEMQDDRVIMPFFDVPHVHKETGWGMLHRQIGGEFGGAYTWDSPLKHYADFDRLQYPRIIIDHETTQHHLELAQEAFGDLLAVRLKTSWVWSWGMTQILINLRGMQQVMLDMYDNPDNLHRLMAFLRDGHLSKLDYLESSNLLSLNNDGTYVGSGGFGWTDELPSGEFNGHVYARDLWGFAESQETVGVSPQMFAEFIMPYQLPLLDCFGLNCYGCCEPLDTRWDTVAQIPRLRRVSMSPWADVARMAECVGDRFIFSRKPHPIAVSGPSFDEDAVRASIRQDLLLTRGCHVELILKDTHTIGNDPNRVIRWVQIAREEIESI